MGSLICEEGRPQTPPASRNTARENQFNSMRENVVWFKESMYRVVEGLASQSHRVGWVAQQTL